MDRLSHIICDAVEAGEWKPFRISNQGPCISHLMFADDLLLFGEASVEQVHMMMTCLDLFCYYSGAKVNKEKSSIFFSKNTPVRCRQELKELTKFKVSDDIGNYLGVPLSRSRKRSQTFHYIVERVQSRLAGWKANCLSLAGRITLAKSVLSSIPLYPMQVARVPVSICRRIEQLQKQFIWGSHDETKKCHLVGWESLCKPKQHGGLGFRNLEMLNRACGSKLAWKISTDNGGLWVDVLSAKYIHNRRGHSFLFKNGDSPLWKFICSNSELIKNGALWRVRNGQSINFFSDQWLQKGIVLNEVCLRPLSSSNVLSKVSDWTKEGEWDMCRIREYFPRHIVSRFAAVLPPNEIYGEDVRVWGHSVSGDFTIRSAYDLLASVSPTNDDRTYKDIWKWDGAERIRVFLWLAFRERLLTNKRRSKWAGIDPCCIGCSGVEEDTMHVLRDCVHAKGIWEKLVRVEAHAVFFSANLKTWFHMNMNKQMGRPDDGTSWKLTWGFTCWKLWIWRNQSIFDERFQRPNDPCWYLLNMRHNVLSDSIGQDNYSLLTPRRWVAPPDGWIKLNTDGAVSKQDSMAACAGVLRDHGGNWVGGFSMFIGVCDPVHVEEWGILKGLSIAWDLGLKHIIVEADAKIVVDRIEQCLSTNLWTNSTTTLLLIKELLGKDWEVRFQFSPRETNMVADFLAKWAINNKTPFTFFDMVLDSAKTLVHKDYLGCQSPL